MLRRIALGLSGVAVLLSVLNCDAGNPRSRRVQFDAKAQTLQDIEDWKEVVDPDTCPLKQYSVALTLTAVTLADGLSCFSAEGGVSPFVQFEMGGKTIRSRTEEDQQFPVYLETFQLGCQDIQEPLVISVVNSQTGQTCFSNTVRHWSYGRTGVYTDTQPAVSENARSGGTGLIKDTQQSYSYVLMTGPSTMDLTINALPGPQETASKWNVHTPADIFGIVFGMMIFVGVVGYFVWKIRNSASGPAPTPAPPSAPEALAISSHGTENRKSKKMTEPAADLAAA